MAQVKVYGLASNLGMCRAKLSVVILACLVEALGLPEDKRFQRFFPLSADDFVFPAGRSSRYTVLEVILFAGRSSETRRTLIRLLMDRFVSELHYDPNDLEVVLLESPRENWGIRGQHGDELDLPYKVEV